MSQATTIRGSWAMLVADRERVAQLSRTPAIEQFLRELYHLGAIEGVRLATAASSSLASAELFDEVRSIVDEFAPPAGRVQ